MKKNFLYKYLKKLINFAILQILAMFTHVAEQRDFVHHGKLAKHGNYL